jgi:hypothetical protein
MAAAILQLVDFVREESRQPVEVVVDAVGENKGMETAR